MNGVTSSPTFSAPVTGARRALPQVALVRGCAVEQGDASLLDAEQLDATQRQVVQRAPGSGSLLVVGAPGSGKTTLLVEVVAHRVFEHGMAANQVLGLAPTRAAAAELRERITARLGRTVTEPMVRTPHSYAFSLLRQSRVIVGESAPRLISGSEQDRILAELLAGHEVGIGAAPQWPEAISGQLRAKPAFRNELRDLLMRCAERQLSPAQLAELGQRYRRADWVAAAQVFQEYLQVTALATPGSYDPASIIGAAVDLLQSDADVLAGQREQYRFVILDDAQEMTSVVRALLATLLSPAHDVLAVGDPDTATLGFRGALPHTLVQLPQLLRDRDGREADVVVLPTVYRHATPIRQAVQRITDRIASAGLVQQRRSAAHRRDGETAAAGEAAAGSVAGEAPVQVRVFASAAAQAAFVAAAMRTAHLQDGMPWRQMAVVVRAGGDIPALRRMLQAHGVPVAGVTAAPVLRDHPASAALLRAMQWVSEHPLADNVAEEVGAAQGETVGAQEDVVTALLLSPLGSADALALRRLRQLGGATSRQPLATLLWEAMTHIGESSSIEAKNVTAANEKSDTGSSTGVSVRSGNAAPAYPVLAPIRRLAAILDAGRAELAQPEATSESVLWAIWDASGLADTWTRQALSAGPGAAQADADADAVCALAEAAARFTDRLPGAGVADFVAFIAGQEVPADSLAPRAPQGDAVSIRTVAAAAGQQWQLVAVPGVQQDSWPNLRLRSTLLGAQLIADYCDRDIEPLGHTAAAINTQRREILDDELRMFATALSRASRTLLVTAVSNDDVAPSPFLDVVDPTHESDDAAVSRAVTTVRRATTLPALVAQLRAAVCDAATEPALRNLAARHLARLAAEGVGGADPQQWHALTPWSSVHRLRSDGQVRVSPSKVESFTKCPLRWLLENSGGRQPSGIHAALGTLIHQIAQQVPDGDLAKMQQLLDDNFSQLQLREGWAADVIRQKAETMLTKFAQYTHAARKAGREVVATELPVRRVLDDAVISGSIDRLERDRNGHLVVVDLKTGTSQPTKAQLPRHAQLGTYQVALEGGQGGSVPVAGAMLVQLGGATKSFTEQRQDALAADPEPGWAHELVRTSAAGMSDATFCAIVNPDCRTCGVRRCCPAHQEGQ